MNTFIVVAVVVAILGGVGYFVYDFGFGKFGRWNGNDKKNSKK